MRDLSFVVVCYNNWVYTKEAIVSLIHALDVNVYSRGIEIIMVNNGSTDETKEGITWLQDNYQTEEVVIEPIHLRENMGYPMGVNIGLDRCIGQYIIVMNNDLIFIDGWLEPLLETLKDEPKLGVVTPHISYGSGIGHVGVVLEDRETIQAYGRRYMEKNAGKIDYVDRVVGACMVMKKSVIDRVGGNDCWYGIGHYDDDDWALRIRIAGYKMAIIGGSFIYHQGSKTFSKYYPEQSYYVRLNRSKFMHKWGLREDRLVDNQYIDRQKLIRETGFSKVQHYIPLHHKAHNKLNHYKPKGRLWVADWTNKQSGWKDNMDTIKTAIKNKEKVYVWIPAQYYTDSERHFIQDKIVSSMYDNHHMGDGLFFLSENIASIGLQGFLKGFKDIIPVKEDFINKSIMYQAK